MIKKLSHKQLKETGRNLGGIYLEENCYTFENAIHYISALEEGPVNSGVVSEKVNEIIRDIKKNYPTAKYCRNQQLFYSSGLYGNTGQLYKMDLVNKNWDEIGKTFYIYF